MCTPGHEPFLLPRNPPYATVISSANPFPVVHAFQDITRGKMVLPQLQTLVNLMASWQTDPPSAFLALSKSPTLPPSSCPDLLKHAQFKDDSENSESDQEEERDVSLPFDRSIVDTWLESVHQAMRECNARDDSMTHWATLGAYADEPCSSPPDYPQWLTESQTARELFATIRLPWRDPKTMAIDTEWKSDHKRSCADAEFETVDSLNYKRRRVALDL